MNEEQPVTEQERREHSRTETEVEIRLADAPDEPAMKVSNLSTGGAYCHSPRPFEAMSQVDVILDLPGPNGTIPVWAEAVVVRVDEQSDKDPRRPYRIALWFQKVSDGHLAILQRYLDDDDG